MSNGDSHTQNLEKGIEEWRKWAIHLCAAHANNGVTEGYDGSTEDAYGHYNSRELRKKLTEVFKSTVLS